SRGLTISRINSKPTLLLRFIKVRERIDRENALKEIHSLVKRWVLAYGPLTPLLAWGDLSDLVVDPGPRVYARVRGIGDGFIPVELEPSQSGEAAGGLGEDLDVNEYLLNRVSERTRTPITAYNPRAMATDHEFRLRVTAHAEPVNQGSLAFRKHPSRPWTLGHLIQSGGITVEDAGRLLLMAMGRRPFSTNGEPRGVLIIGEMGSGKTTLTNAILNTMPPWVRVSAIQDVDEFLFTPGRSTLLLNTRASTGLGVREISKAELIGDAMRTGAGFVFVNEILYPEDAKAWLLAVTSGHGGVTSIHAGDLDDLVMRLEGFGVVGAGGLIRRSIIVVKMINKRVTNVYYPEKTDPNAPVPSIMIDGLRSIAEAPDDYTRITGLWESLDAWLNPKPLEPTNPTQASSGSHD
ncbi:ATPase, T2SS/T4P/T4SS family, partial [Caldivirga sp.]|uniref:ATPase, T2SS/T4P/T4SS family n=1 Tax=Caldivirga sp. TaxID=2080243 RepID=UPI003D1038D7